MSSPFPKTIDKVKGVEILAPIPDNAKHIFNIEALGLLATLHRNFNGKRKELLANRKIQQQREMLVNYLISYQKQNKLEKILLGLVLH